MRKRTLVGLLLLFAGFGFGGAGGYLMVEVLDRNTRNEEAIRMAETSCREQIVKIGTYVPLPDDKVTVVLKEADDPRQAMADLTGLIATCPTRQIESACIGTVCGGGNKANPSSIRATATLVRKPF